MRNNFMRHFVLLTTSLIYFQLGVISYEQHKCTSIIVGPVAGISGPMVTQTADCSDCDFRINKVRSQNWKRKTIRPTYEYIRQYPTTIANDRGDTWQPSNLEGTTSQLKYWGIRSTRTGHIPQVEHTNALIESGLAIMNEHQLAMGGSTCGAKLWAFPTSIGGTAQLDVRELSRLALERTSTARDAILLMGGLAEKYGLYTSDWTSDDAASEEGGGSLGIIDTKEAWIFHILSDDSKSSAVWAAQRVPDDHIAVVANQFIIRYIDPNSNDFMYSSNLWDVAERNGFWKKEDGLLDFLKTYGPIQARAVGITRREWRVMSLMAPSLNLSPYTDEYSSNYPFSIKPDNIVTLQDLMKIHRDHYENTDFDLTKGLAAGPYGDPDRFDIYPTDNMTESELLEGHFERAISLFRSSYCFIAEVRPDLPPIIGARVWMSQYAPSISSFIPLYVYTEKLPKAYTIGSLFKFDLKSSYWNFAVVGNYMTRFYSYAIEDVKALQDRLFNEALHRVQVAEGKALDLLAILHIQNPKHDKGKNKNKSGTTTTPTSTSTPTVSPSQSPSEYPTATTTAIPESPPPSTSPTEEPTMEPSIYSYTTIGDIDTPAASSSSIPLSSKEKEKVHKVIKAVTQIITDVTVNTGEMTVTEWKSFFPLLVAKYHDGYVLQHPDASIVNMKKLFYPKWWLEDVGYFNSENAPNSGDNVIKFISSPNNNNNNNGHNDPVEVIHTSNNSSKNPQIWSFLRFFYIVSISGIFFLPFGFLMGRWMARRHSAQYTPIVNRPQ
eukprot:gene4647-9217_t